MPIPRSPLPVVCLLLAGLLAGCVGTEPTPIPGPGDAGDDAAMAPPAQPSAIAANESALIGLVVNPSLEPVADATVALQGTDHGTTTDAGGRYLLQNLPPGAHVVFAQAPQFAVATQAVTLVAGKGAELNFILEEVPGADPHTKVLEQSGFLECQTGAVAVTMNCVPIQNVLNDLGTNPTNTKQILEWEFAVEGLRAVVLEMVWQPPIQGTAGELQVLFESASTDLIEGETYGQAQGPSGVTLEFIDDQLQPILDSNATLFQTRTFPPFEPGTLVLQQKFTIFLALFYHQFPPPDYSSIPDGYVP